MKKLLFTFCLLAFLTISAKAQDFIQSIRSGDLEAVKKKVEANPELVRNPASGNSTLMFAVLFKQPEIVKYLAGKGADVNYANDDITPLFFAVRNGDVNMTRLLADRGADIHFRTPLGESFLHFAALMNKTDMAKHLLESGIHVDVLKNGNLTPLHIAAVMNHKEMVGLLMANGAKLNSKSADGGTPLHFAQAAGNAEIARLFISKGAEQGKRSFPEYKGPYLGQKLNGDDPVIFVPELFRDIYRVHSSLSFSPDGAEVFWECMFMPGNNDGHRVWHMEMKNGVWQAPTAAQFAGPRSGGPDISPDGEKVIFHSMRATEEEPGKSDLDLWSAEKVNGNWSEAKHLGYELNSSKEMEAYPFWGNSHTIYLKYVSGPEIVKSKAVNGVFQKPESLGDLFNSNYIDDCRDLDHLIFYSDKGRERFDYRLHICFHKKDGTWTPAIYMGDKLHQGKRATLSKISRDRKYLFFERGFSSYWIDAKLIENFRQEAFADKK